MKGRTIILDQMNGREAAALMVDGKLEDFLVEGSAPAPGTIYRARADRPVKGQGGMFVTTPDGPAFLKKVKGLAPGAMVMVQVTGYSEPGKAIPVTGKLLFKSRHVIVTPASPGRNISRSIRDEKERDRLLEIAHAEMEESAFGLILRSSCAGADAADIAGDVASTLALANQVMTDNGTSQDRLIDGDGPHALAWREWAEMAEVIRDPEGFEQHGVLDALEGARGPQEPLAGGGCLFIEPTRALVAVDVNTGKDISMAAGLKANLACARALPRALRVRGLGGQITLDLAPMPKKDRRSFETALRASLRADSEDTVLVGWTPLGHYELHRKRGRVPLGEVLQ